MHSLVRKSEGKITPLDLGVCKVLISQMTCDSVSWGHPKKMSIQWRGRFEYRNGPSHYLKRAITLTAVLLLGSQEGFSTIVLLKLKTT
jgi:hypothetical protein